MHPDGNNDYVSPATTTTGRRSPPLPTMATAASPLVRNQFPGDFSSDHQKQDGLAFSLDLGRSCERPGPGERERERERGGGGGKVGVATASLRRRPPCSSCCPCRPWSCCCCCMIYVLASPPPPSFFLSLCVLKAKDNTLGACIVVWRITERIC